MNDLKSVDIPAPPMKMSTTAAQYYNGLCEAMREDGAFMKRDHIVAAIFCKTLDMYLKACQRLNDFDDFVVQYKNGSNMSGDGIVYFKLLDKLNELMPQLGIGFKNREKTVTYINNQMNLFDAPDPWAERIDKTIDVSTN